MYERVMFKIMNIKPCSSFVMKHVQVGVVESAWGVGWNSGWMYTVCNSG